jgi:hypothetical protein
MSIFSKRFNRVLSEAPTIPVPPEEVPEELPVDAAAEDEEAFNASLDQGTDPGEFNDVDSAVAQASELQRQQSEGQITTIKQWVDDIEGFIGFLNGLDSPSLQAQLNDAPCDTLFNDIARSETKKISRLAQDLSSLSESLKGYILSHDDDGR